jgi:hypothetical protein
VAKNIKNYRKLLTPEEWNAISHLTGETKLDMSFDIDHAEMVRQGKTISYDCFRDMETGRRCSLKTGFEWLFDGIAYPLQHDNMSKEEAEIIVKLLKEFIQITDDQAKWLLSENYD